MLVQRIVRGQSSRIFTFSHLFHLLHRRANDVIAAGHVRGQREAQNNVKQNEPCPPTREHHQRDHCRIKKSMLSTSSRCWLPKPKGERESARFRGVVLQRGIETWQSRATGKSRIKEANLGQ